MICVAARSVARVQVADQAASNLTTPPVKMQLEMTGPAESTRTAAPELPDPANPSRNATPVRIAAHLNCSMQLGALPKAMQDPSKTTCIYILEKQRCFVLL